MPYSVRAHRLRTAACTAALQSDTGSAQPHRSQACAPGLRGRRRGGAGGPHPVHEAQVDVRVERLAGRLDLGAQLRHAAAGVQRAAPRRARRQRLHRVHAAALLAHRHDVVQALRARRRAAPCLPRRAERRPVLQARPCAEQRVAAHAPRVPLSGTEEGQTAATCAAPWRIRKPSPRCHPRILWLQRWRGPQCRQHLNRAPAATDVETHRHAASVFPARLWHAQSRTCASSMLRRLWLGCATDWRNRLRRSAALSMPVCARAGARRGQDCWQAGAGARALDGRVRLQEDTL